MNRAICFREFGPPSKVLFLGAPALRRGQIKASVLASPINPADLNQIQGVYPTKPTFDVDGVAVGGNEGVVEITDAGEAKGWRRGDWAIMKRPGLGTWRTHAAFDQGDLIPIDKTGITAIQAATLSINPCTAYCMLKEFVHLQRNDWFIQNGANSAVGRAAIQLGRLWGVKSINIVRDRPKLAALKEELQKLGADHVVTEEELQDKGFRKQIAEWTCNKGAGLGLNCVGGPSATNIARSLANGGHLVTYGAMAKQPVTIPPSLFIFKDIHLHGFWVSAWGAKFQDRKERILHELLGLIRAGQFSDTPCEMVSWSASDSPDVCWQKMQHAIKVAESGTGLKQILVQSTESIDSATWKM